MGKLEVLDVPGRRFTGAIRGLAGGVRALAVHPTLPVLASVGLDRYLRLHDTESRHMLAKVYCKTLPTGAPQRRWYAGFCANYSCVAK